MENEKQGTTESIEAIILKHCPETDNTLPDKSEWMTDAMREIIDLVCNQRFLFRSDVRQKLTEDAIPIMKAALAEHEELNK